MEKNVILTITQRITIKNILKLKNNFKNFRMYCFHKAQTLFCILSKIVKSKIYYIIKLKKNTFKNNLTF